MSSKDLRKIAVEMDGPHSGKVTVGETDMSSATRRVEIAVQGGRLPEVILHMKTGQVAAHLTDAEIRVDQATAAALIELGWTPPGIKTEPPATAGLKWTTGYVEPGTSYPDEVGVEVPSGWYVWGTDPEADVENGPRVVLHVQHAVDAEGEWSAQQLAEQLAGYLGAPVFTEFKTAEHVLTWHPISASDDGMDITDGDPVEIPLGEPWVLPGTDVSVGEFRLSTREVPEGEVSGG